MSVRKVTRTVEEFWDICARCGKEYKLAWNPEKVPLDTTEPNHEDWCRECWLLEASKKAREDLAFLVGSSVVEFRIVGGYCTKLDSIRLRVSDGRLFDVSGVDDLNGMTILDVEEVKP